MISDIKYHFRENVTVSGILRVVPRHRQGLKRPLCVMQGNWELNISLGVGIGIKLGCCYMILTIKHKARKNAAVKGIFWVVFGF